MPNILKTISFSSKGCHYQALDISKSGLIAVCREDAVEIVDLMEQPAIPTLQTETIVYHLTRIPAEDMQFKTGMTLTKHEAMGDAEYITDTLSMELSIDRAFNHTIKDSQLQSGYKQAKWSPEGMDPMGRSCLAVRTLDYRLSVYSQRTKAYSWFRELDLSDILLDHKRKTDFKKDLNTLKKTQKLSEFQNRVYSVIMIDLVWFPYLVPNTEQNIPEPVGKKSKMPPSAEIKRKSNAVLATATKSGDIVMWKIDTALQSGSIEEIMSLGKDVQISTMLWCTTNQSSRGYLVVGCVDGRILSLNMSNYTVTELWTEKDLLKVNNIIWIKQTNVLLASKQGHVVLVQTVSNEDFSIRRKKTQAVSGKWPICGLAVTDDSTVYLTIADASIMFGTVKITDTEMQLELQSLVIRKTFPPATRSHGLSVSTNSAYITVMESPSEAFCHLTYKESLKVYLICIKTLEEVCKIVTETSEESLHQLSDLLLIIKYYAQQEATWPTDLDTFIKDLGHGTLLEMCTTMQLKLHRYLFRMKISCCPKLVPEESKEVLQGYIDQLDTEILKRHAISALQKCLDMGCSETTINEIEKKSVSLMYSFLKKIHQDCPSDTIHDLLNKVENSMPVLKDTKFTEVCQICRNNLNHKTQRQYSCEKSHMFGCCVQTFVTCQIPPFRKCKSCGALAMQISDPGVSTGWLSSIQNNQCVLCDHNLLYGS